MRILADENIARVVVGALRTSGHDVESVRDIMRGAGDLEVFDRARSTNRVVLTIDQDFGHLVFKLNLRPEPGVILIRDPALHPAGAAEYIALAVELVEQRLAEFGHAGGFFATVRPGRISFRLLKT